LRHVPARVPHWKVLDQRGSVDDPTLTVDHLSQLVERAETGGLAGLAQHAGLEPARLGVAHHGE
jgi:hypothetical protein